MIWYAGMTPRLTRAAARAFLEALVLIAGAAAWFYLITLNAYDAGRAVGYQQGYDAASVVEAEKWGSVPKTCKHDMAYECEKWWFEHNPPVNEMFKSDPRQSR